METENIRTTINSAICSLYSAQQALVNGDKEEMKAKVCSARDTLNQIVDIENNCNNCYANHSCSHVNRTDCNCNSEPNNDNVVSRFNDEMKFLKEKLQSFNEGSLMTEFNRNGDLGALNYILNCAGENNVKIERTASYGNTSRTIKFTVSSTGLIANNLELTKEHLLRLASCGYKNVSVSAERTVCGLEFTVKYDFSDESRKVSPIVALANFFGIV